MKRLLAVLALLLLSGCSSSHAEEGIPSATTPTSATQSVPSVAQWASAVAPLKAEWEATQADWEDATCSVIAAGEGAADCAAMLVTMQIQAATVHLKVTALTDPNSPSYLGAAPAEVAAAYQALVEAATAANIWDTAPVDCPGDTCGHAALEFEMAWNGLGAAFAAWEPWL